jgi:SAGA-associated factor 73
VKVIKVEKQNVLKKIKVSVPVNLDTQCGVKLELGGLCGRSISCKMHPIAFKRSVVGRSTTYDILHAEYYAKASITKKNNSVPTASLIPLINEGGIHDPSLEDDIMGLLSI